MSEREAEVITLADATAAYHFRVGMPVELTMMSSGAVRVATWSERARRRVARFYLRWTRWFRHRTSVVAIDHDAGAVTLACERWSWRRWRWERA